jgi:hypothetical protein
VFVHYAKNPIDDGVVVPWAELTLEQRTLTGHEGRVHGAGNLGHYSDRLVFVHDLPRGHPLLGIGTGYASPDAWVYEVEPLGTIWRDPEQQHLPMTSRTCARARVVKVVHDPNTCTPSSIRPIA